MFLVTPDPPYPQNSLALAPREEWVRQLAPLLAGSRQLSEGQSRREVGPACSLRKSNSVLGHPSRPAHAIWTLPAFLAEAPAPLGTSGWDFPFCHPARGRAKGCRLWMVAWGVLVWAKQPVLSILTSHAGKAGRESRQGMLVRLRGGHFATQLCPAQSTVCPPKLELKLPTSPLGLPRQRCFKGPIFSTF